MGHYRGEMMGDDDRESSAAVNKLPSFRPLRDEDESDDRDTPAGIESQMVRLDKGLQSLQESVGSLAHRLGPFLRESDPDEGSEKVDVKLPSPSSHSEQFNMLQQFIYHVDSLESRIVELGNRVDR